MSKQENKEKKWNVMKYDENDLVYECLQLVDSSAACHQTPCIRAIVIE